MGNSLRYFLAKKYVVLRIQLFYVVSPKVTFAGYSIPHPSDPIMNLRIQTVGLISHIRICPDTNIEGYTAVEALKQALQDLQQVCNHIKTTFQTQVETQ